MGLGRAKQSAMRSLWGPRNILAKRVALRQKRTMEGCDEGGVMSGRGGCGPGRALFDRSAVLPMPPSPTQVETDYLSEAERSASCYPNKC